MRPADAIPANARHASGRPISGSSGLTATSRIFVILIFLIVASQLESFTQPSAIMPSLPDNADERRLREVGRRDALVEAGAVRPRPIIMTTLALAMMAGMAAIALALGEVAASALR